MTKKKAGGSFSHAHYAVDWSNPRQSGRELFTSPDDTARALARYRAMDGTEADAIYLGKRPERIEEAKRRGWRTYLS